MSDLLDDLLGGEDDTEELGNEDESVIQDIFGPNSGINKKTSKEFSLDIANEIAIDRGKIIFFLFFNNNDYQFMK